LQTVYMKEIQDLKKRKGIRKEKKIDMEQTIIKEHHSNIKKLKSDYKDVEHFMKQHKLATLDLAFKQANIEIKKIKKIIYIQVKT
jgi:hypothetical protein